MADEEKEELDASEDEKASAEDAVDSGDAPSEDAAAESGEAPSEGADSDADAILAELAGAEGEDLDIDAILSDASVAADDVSESDRLAESEVSDLLSGLGGATDTDSSKPMEYESFNDLIPSGPESKIEMLGDVNLKIKILLGRSRMQVENVLKLGKGSVIQLDKTAGDPLDIIVNDELVARGEVLILNDNFCVRVTDIISPDERSN